MKSDTTPATTDQSHKHRRPKHREVSSRFLSPTATPPENTTPPSPNRTLSPLRRKPNSSFTDTRKPKTQLDESNPVRGLWPSSTSSNKKIDTLADHLGNDRYKDLIDRKNSIFDGQRSSRESERDGGAKENHQPIIGGSMRYTGRFRFPGKSSSSSSSSSSKFSSNSNVVIAPRRFSVDENALSRKPSRRISDSFAETGSDCSDDTGMDSPNVGPDPNSRKSGGVEVSSKYMNIETAVKHRRGTSDSNLPKISGDKSPKLNNKFTIKNVMRRAHSLTATTQWALSPGRTGLPTMSVENKSVPMSFSSMKPPTSPSKSKGMEKLLNLGLDLFKSSKRSSTSSSTTTPVLVRTNSNPSGSGQTESGHQLKVLHNRLMQWRYANAKADVVNEKIADQAQASVICAWDYIVKLRHSVVQKKLKLEKGKLDLKLNAILHSQLRPLESWGDMERQHMAAVEMMKEFLHSVVCRVPLIEGAEVDTQSAIVALRHASDLTASIKLMLSTFSALAEEISPLLSELAKVVAQEKLLLEECLELSRTISTLEIEERSLKCGTIQLKLYNMSKLSCD